jgi:hypothetical protein
LALVDPSAGQLAVNAAGPAGVGGWVDAGAVVDVLGSAAGVVGSAGGADSAGAVGAGAAPSVGAAVDRAGVGDGDAPGDPVGVDFDRVFVAVGVGPPEADDAADLVAVADGEPPATGTARQPTAAATTRKAPITTRVALRPHPHRVPM